MAKKMGVWMDKRQAKIISIEDGGKILTTVQSGIEEYHPKGGSGTKVKGGPQDVVQDSKYLEREKHQMKSYFRNVIGTLGEADALVVFGPSQTGQKFVDELLDHHQKFHGRIAGIERSDNMTDNQLVAWVREFFEKP